MSKETQTPLGGLFGKKHFGNIGDIEHTMEEDIDVLEESQDLENSKFDGEFGLHDIVHQFNLEENVKFDNSLIRYISTIMTFGFYFRNKIFIYIVFNMLFTNIWYSFL